MGEHKWFPHRDLDYGCESGEPWWAFGTEKGSFCTSHFILKPCGLASGWICALIYARDCPCSGVDPKSPPLGGGWAP